MIPTSPRLEGEVGRVGMAVDSLQDFDIAFQDIQFDRIGSGLTINAVASIMLAMYQATAEKFGYPKEKISATPQNDILKEMIGRGAWIFPGGTGRATGVRRHRVFGQRTSHAAIRSAFAAIISENPEPLRHRKSLMRLR